MYYIYHIPGVKIGCTADIKRRQYQLKQELLILEEHTDIYEASSREIELQKEYGYKVDTVPYYHACTLGYKGGKISKRPGSLTRKQGEEIKELYKDPWWSYYKIADEYNISEGSIAKVIKNKYRYND